MADEDDILDIVDDVATERGAEARQRWKVAIIDDDPAVHSGTRFALYDYALAGHGLELISATSAAEGRALLAAHPDTAVVLLDVVMESDGAGLDLVDYIRKELMNETVRIILRTGQPGQAPERRVILDYDINDYKAKTELTADKLFTTLTAALRSYQQLQRMVETRRGLELIIDAAPTLFDFKSMQRLAEGVLTQIASLLEADCAGILVLRESGAGEGFSVLAGSGVYAPLAGTHDPARLKPDLARVVEAAFERRHNEFEQRRSVLYVNTQSGREVVVLLEVGKTLTDTDRALVEVFCSRLSIAFDNVILYEKLQDANRRLEARVAERTRALTAANQRLHANWVNLRRANAYKNELLGTVAHDLKNPLGVVLGRTEIMDELLRAEPIAPEPLGTQVVHIREAAKRLLGMVETLIVDAMADADDITLRKEVLDLAALVREVTETNRPLAERKQQQLTLATPANLAIDGDFNRLREAVDNLVSNAIKYTPLGGRIHVGLDVWDDQALVTVADSGPGFSPEDQNRLFGRFQRLSAKPTGGESSTGLGLSIAKRIVDLHGGRIAAESRGEAVGTRFTIALPLHKAESP
jgi:signal transduction histidine kinase/DNA-binding NarL/FixJ family response regulator